MHDLQPCAGVNLGFGPHWLSSLKWRVLYELTDLYDRERATTTPHPCVMERHLLSRLADVVDLGRNWTMATADDFVFAVDPIARNEVRDALGDLARDHCVILPTEPSREAMEWCIQLTAVGYMCAAQWRRHWIQELERRASVPSGWRAWLTGIVAPPQAVTFISPIITLAAGFFLGHFTGH